MTWATVTPPMKYLLHWEGGKEKYANLCNCVGLGKKTLSKRLGRLKVVNLKTWTA